MARNNLQRFIITMKLASFIKVSRLRSIKTITYRNYRAMKLFLPLPGNLQRCYLNKLGTVIIATFKCNPQ